MTTQLKAKLLSASWEEFIVDAIDLSQYDRILIMFSGGKDSLCSLLVVLHLLEMQGLRGKAEVELWHHLVDGREGSTLMDWSYTESYCRARVGDRSVHIEGRVQPDNTVTMTFVGLPPEMAKAALEAIAKA